MLLAMLAVAAAWPSPASGGFPNIFHTDPNAATTSRKARDEALQGIPVDKLSAEAKAKVNNVVSDITIYRRMPVRVTQCDPELYLFLVGHPDVVVNIWEVLGVTKLKLRQTGPDIFQVIDSVGTVSSMEYIYRSHDTQVIYAEGRYEGSLFAKPVVGRGLVVLKTGYAQEPNGRYYITSRLDSFVRLDSAGAELVAKTLQPVVGKVADNNFIQTTAFLGALSKTAEVNERGVARLADKLNNVQPEVRDEFAQVAAAVAERAEKLPAGSTAERPLVATRPEESADR